MAEESTNTPAAAPVAPTAGSQDTGAQAPATPAAGAQAPAETMTPEQAAAKIEQLKADPAYRKVLLGQQGNVGTLSARKEWDKLHQIAHGSVQAEAEPEPYRINSQLIAKNSPFVGWMRSIGADQGFVDGAVHLAEKLGDTVPSDDEVADQGGRALEVLQRKYGPEGAQAKIDAARGLIKSLPAAEREQFEAYLDKSGLGSHPWMVERLSLLSERKAR